MIEQPYAFPPEVQLQHQYPELTVGGDVARVRVDTIRCPDTCEILGWIAQCPVCQGYVVGDERDREKVLTMAHHHACPIRPPSRRRLRWRGLFAWQRRG